MNSKLIVTPLKDHRLSQDSNIHKSQSSLPKNDRYQENKDSSQQIYDSGQKQSQDFNFRESKFIGHFQKLRDLNQSRFDSIQGPIPFRSYHRKNLIQDMQYDTAKCSNYKSNYSKDFIPCSTTLINPRSLNFKEKNEQAAPLTFDEGKINFTTVIKDTFTQKKGQDPYKEAIKIERNTLKAHQERPFVERSTYGQSFLKSAITKNVLYTPLPNFPVLNNEFKITETSEARRTQALTQRTLRSQTEWKNWAQDRDRNLKLPIGVQINIYSEKSGNKNREQEKNFPNENQEKQFSNKLAQSSYNGFYKNDNKKLYQETQQTKQFNQLIFKLNQNTSSIYDYKKTNAPNTLLSTSKNEYPAHLYREQYM